MEDHPRLVSRRQLLRVAAATAGSMALAACGPPNTTQRDATGTPASAPAESALVPVATASAAAVAPATTGGAVPSGGATTITWATWGDPAEVQRFVAYTEDFNKRHPEIQASLIPLPSGDQYGEKLDELLANGATPDMFYANDLVKAITSKSILELTDRLTSDTSKSKPEDFAEGLWGLAKNQHGKLWGVPVDCNPIVLWYSPAVLQDAGISTMPADLAKAGTWTWDAFQKMLRAVAAKGKHGLIFSNWWGSTYAWVTTNGGRVYDQTSFIGNQDAKTVAAFTFIQDNLANKTYTYDATLPDGQNDVERFEAQQAAFITAGRWLLPGFKENTALTYDVVTHPTNTGKPIEPTPIVVAYAVLNAKTPHPDAAFALLTDFVSKDGQAFRLKGGGNAVPSVKGTDEVVAEGNLPANWKAFIAARDTGYMLWRIEAATPGLSDDISMILDELWLKGGDIQATLDKIATMANQKLKEAGTA